MMIRRILIMFLLTVALLEVGLRIVDPLGLLALLSDLAFYARHAQPDESGFRLDAGRYAMSHWVMTIEQNGARMVPNTSRSAPCRLVAIGDSMTFGWGVDDAQMWVNYLAQRFQSVRFVNAARPTYEIGNIIRLLDEYEGDGYLYLAFENDSVPPVNHLSFGSDPGFQLAIRRHLEFVVTDRQPPQYDHGYMIPYIPMLTSREDVLIIGFANQMIGHDLNAIRIPYFTQTVSVADNHPNPTGHAQIAEAMRPHVAAFIAERCR